MPKLTTTNIDFLNHHNRRNIISAIPDGQRHHLAVLFASNWAKFSTTAALGIIHKGYFEEGMNILGPYLPQVGGESQIPGAAYSEGGALLRSWPD